MYVFIYLFWLLFFSSYYYDQYLFLFSLGVATETMWIVKLLLNKSFEFEFDFDFYPHYPYSSSSIKADLLDRPRVDELFCKGKSHTAGTRQNVSQSTGTSATPSELPCTQSWRKQLCNNLSACLGQRCLGLFKHSISTIQKLKSQLWYLVANRCTSASKKQHCNIHRANTYQTLASQYSHWGFKHV